MSPTETQRHNRFLRSFTANEQAIRAYVRRMVPTRGDADDVMQETSVVLWEKFDTFREDGDFRTWAFGVARYEVLAWLRDKGRDRLVLNEENRLVPGSLEYPDSRTPVLPEEGRWVHLAAGYDSAAHTVRFYLNGRLDKETHQTIAHPARLGAAQIGNWDTQDRKLSGRVDELLLLGRAMSDDEVSALFEAGNPYH
jgi:RNA polymerase sigma factor (sigma-70 family)